MPFASATGFKSGVSREAGPPPLMSTPAGDCLSKRNTVQPVKPLVSSAWPILKPPISIMSISCIFFTLYQAFLLIHIFILPFPVQLPIKQADLNSPPYIQFHNYFKVCLKLFRCDWFDCVQNQSNKVYDDCGNNCLNDSVKADDSGDNTKHRISSHTDCLCISILVKHKD